MTRYLNIAEIVVILSISSLLIALTYAVLVFTNGYQPDDIVTAPGERDTRYEN